MLDRTGMEGMVSVLVWALCLVHFASLLARPPNPKRPGSKSFWPQKPLAQVTKPSY
jgi:hypothetical protein